MACAFSSWLLPLIATMTAMVAISAEGKDVVLAPVQADKPCAVLVIIQGAQVPAERYIPLMQAVQKAAANLSLWLGSPDFELNTPEPLVINSGVETILDAMHALGMNASQCALFVGGHSLGGALVQSWTITQEPDVFEAAGAPGTTEHGAHNGRLGGGLKIRGQVLLGAFLLRKWRNQTGDGRFHYPVATLTVGGELDGLSRISRMAEGYWHQVLHPDAGQVGEFPLVVLPGVSHFQFASGAPPEVVKARDFHPEVSYDDAHAAIAAAVAAFLTRKTVRDDAETRLGAAERLVAMVKDTGELVGPLISALTAEGFYHFRPPCNSNPVSAACTAGSEWSAVAQSQYMAGVDQVPGLKVVAADRFHPVYQVNPVHLPHTHNNCTSPAACTLNVSTVTQNIYAELDELDTAFFPVAATTMRVKMKSRQAVWEAAGVAHVNFNTTDGGSVCQAINRAALAWARGRAAEKSLARFDKLGEPLLMGMDLGPYNAGPLWIWNDLHYDEDKKSSPGRPTVTVRAPMMRTPNDYWEPTARGFHYCKLLSPARAMEWIYVDGLRAHDSLSNSTAASAARTAV